MIYFTSDTHFNHFNAIAHSNRPFKTMEEMNEAMIENWNARVRPQDEVWHLGDFSFGNQMEEVPKLLKRLNGRVHFIWGNHDKKPVRKLSEWASSQPVAEIKLDGENIVLSHYSHRVWNRGHYGAYHFYGHSHGSLPGFGRSLDVGVDCWNFMPVTFDEIRQRLTENGEITKFGIHH